MNGFIVFSKCGSDAENKKDLTQVFFEMPIENQTKRREKRTNTKLKLEQLEVQALGLLVSFS